jgi:hypothetical protein
MESIIPQSFRHNWQQKLVALASALVIWFFVSHSIIETKVIPGVPIRIVNLPADKTILGLNPNGLLSKRVTLTLTGTKEVIQDIEPGDLEALIDASMIDHDDWVVQINKKNLVSLNPEVDLKNHISQISYTEHVIRVRPLVTEKVPITIQPPVGTPPDGYEYLDIWPQRIMQTITGAAEEIQHLKITGLEVTYDLNQIKKADLDASKSSHNHLQDDEISFMIPNNWKKITIPFHNNAKEEFNDPEAKILRIDFLRKELLPIKNVIPIRVFYPLKFSDAINPGNYHLKLSPHIQEKNNLTFFSPPLFAKGVSRLFLDCVRENMEITIVAAPKAERELLHWTLDIVDAGTMEDIYVAFLISHLNNTKTNPEPLSKNRELLFRNRFRDYVQKLTLYSSPEDKLHLEGKLENNTIEVLSENF